MVIGERLGFLFIHVPKCAGESIRELLLAPANGGRDFLGKHSTYEAALLRLGGSLASLESFAVVRNPFEQVLSFYEHLRKPLFVPHEALERQYPGSAGLLHPEWACELAMREDFPAFVRQAYGMSLPASAPPGAGRNLLRDSCAWMTGPDACISVRRVLRFERLAEGFDRLSGDLGLSGTLPHLNAAHNAADTRSYRARYDEPAREVVERHFARTLREFGYRF
ncbi:MAG: hypothetical protein FGM39_02615 [Phycisphaerales bacterium]|nr:hypothetical protein [Phycisphaerales bacterium]